MKKFLRKSKYFSWFFIPVLISGILLFTAFSMQVPQGNPVQNADKENLSTLVTEIQDYNNLDEHSGKEKKFEGENPQTDYPEVHGLNSQSTIKDKNNGINAGK